MANTHTYAVLEISQQAYSEIRDKLAAAGYRDAIHREGDNEVINMHGIAIGAVQELNSVYPGVASQIRQMAADLEVAGAEGVPISIHVSHGCDRDRGLEARTGHEAWKPNGHRYYNVHIWPKAS